MYKTVAQIKKEAVEHYSRMSTQERLGMANWTPNNMEPSLSSKLGSLYYGTGRIWITPDGKIYANKPSVK